MPAQELEGRLVHALAILQHVVQAVPAGVMTKSNASATSSEG